MKQVDKISIDELKTMSEHMYDCLVKDVDERPRNPNSETWNNRGVCV